MNTNEFIELCSYNRTIQKSVESGYHYDFNRERYNTLLTKYINLTSTLNRFKWIELNNLYLTVSNNFKSISDIIRDLKSLNVRGC